MPSTINHNWREEVLKYRYPFSPESTLRSESVFIGTDLLMDACIYIKRPVQLPLRLHSLDGTRQADTLRAYICDSNSDICAYFDIREDTQNALVHMPEGLSCGVVVLNPPAVRRVVNVAYGRVTQLPESCAVFLLETTPVTRTKYLRYVRVNGVTLTGDVSLVAGPGCEFEEDAGCLRLNVRGAPPAEGGATPIRTINSVLSKDIWLQNHPQANIRIFSSGEALQIKAARDSI